MTTFCIAFYESYLYKDTEVYNCLGYLSLPLPQIFVFGNIVVFSALQLQSKNLVIKFLDEKNGEYHCNSVLVINLFENLCHRKYKKTARI
jgi:hypothetical protein